jgi:hypothetical protein
MMDEGVYLFNKINKNFDLVEEALSFDASNLESIDGLMISKYCIALSQYLVYFTSVVNSTKAEINSIKRFIESSLNVSLTKDLLKQYKTKIAASEYLIMNDEILHNKQEKVNDLQDELIKVEGINKSIDTLISTFKRELTRRENELYVVRQERKY